MWGNAPKYKPGCGTGFCTDCVTPTVGVVVGAWVDTPAVVTTSVVVTGVVVVVVAILKKYKFRL